MKTPVQTEPASLQLYIARITAITVAVFCWNAATNLWDQGDIVREITPILYSFLLYGIAAGLIVTGVTMRIVRRWHDWAIFTSIIAVFLGFWLHTLIQHQSFYVSTDAFIYQEHAAYALLNGENPYSENMMNAFRDNRMPLTFSTPLLSGDVTATASYPALGFLLFVPIILLGLPTTYIYFLFFLAVIALLYWKSPKPLRPLVLLPILIESRFAFFSLAGVTDIVWVFFLCLVVIDWRKRNRSAIWFGLACAYKQHPWVMLPFILVSVFLEVFNREERNYVSAGREAVRYFGVLLATFMTVNLPFIIWNPGDWIASVGEPWVGDMIVYGQGLSVLTMQGYVVLPDWFFASSRYALLGISLVIYVFFWNRLRLLMWVLPSFVLWFGHRSLASYWYFNIIPLILAITLHVKDREIENLPLLPNMRLVGRVVFVAVVVVVLAIGGSVLFLAQRPPMIEVEVVQPIQIVDNRIGHLQVIVTNHTSRDISPRFAVQNAGLQPYYWEMLSGPRSLPANSSVLYTIQNQNGARQVDQIRGAQVVVTDASTYDIRGSTVISGEPTLRIPDHIPNSTFAFWNYDSNTGQSKPLHWGTAGNSSEAITLSLPKVDHDAFTYALQLEATPDDSEAMQFYAADVWTPVPYIPFDIWVNPPTWANTNLMTSFYGVELRPTLSNELIWVLFGDVESELSGQFDNGIHYLILPAEYEMWSKHTIFVPELFDMFDIQLAPPYPFRTRFSDLEFPLAMMNVRLFVATTAPLVDTFQVQFGPIIAQQNRADLRRVSGESISNPVNGYMARAEHNLKNGNYEGARTYYLNALDLNTFNPQAYYGLAQADLAARDWSRAILHFQAAQAQGDIRNGNIENEMGWARLQLGEVDAAYEHMVNFAFNGAQSTGAERAVLYRQYGWVALAAGRYDEAHGAFSMSLTSLIFDSEAQLGQAIAGFYMQPDEVGSSLAKLDEFSRELWFSDFQCSLMQSYRDDIGIDFDIQCLVDRD